MDLADRLARQERAAKADTHRLHQQILVGALVALDVLALLSAFGLAYVLRFVNPWLPYYAAFSPEFYVRLMVLIVPLYIGTFALNRLYNHHHLFGGTKEYALIATCCTYGVVLVITYSFFDRAGDVVLSRGWLLAFWFLSIMVVGAGRFGFRRLIHRLRWAGYLLERTLVVGTNEEARAVAEQLQANPPGGLSVVGFVGERMPLGSSVLSDLRVLGNDGDLPRLIDDLGIQEIIIAPTAVSRERLLDLYRTLGDSSRVHLRLSSGVFEMLTTGVQVREVGSVPLISLNRLRITGVDAVLKGILDYSIAIPGIIVLSPVMLFIALLVKATSPGPVLHRRRVMGVRGTTFDALKFRTMVQNADGVLAQLLASDPALKREYEAGAKLRKDPRVTPLGRWLRKYSLDELPQLFNVVTGQMSLVGPRMIAPEELPRYGNWSMNLLTVKPGMTGPWQVKGRGDLSYEERVRLSMDYIRNYSIWTDLKLLYDTATVVIQGRGAY